MALKIRFYGNEYHVSSVSKDTTFSDIINSVVQTHFNNKKNINNNDNNNNKYNNNNNTVTTINNNRVIVLNSDNPYLPSEPQLEGGGAYCLFTNLFISKERLSTNKKAENKLNDKFKLTDLIEIISKINKLTSLKTDNKENLPSVNQINSNSNHASLNPSNSTLNSSPLTKSAPQPSSDSTQHPQIKLSQLIFEIKPQFPSLNKNPCLENNSKFQKFNLLKKLFNKNKILKNNSIKCCCHDNKKMVSQQITPISSIPLTKEQNLNSCLSKSHQKRIIRKSVSFNIPKNNNQFDDQSDTNSNQINQLNEVLNNDVGGVKKAIKRNFTTFQKPQKFNFTPPSHLKFPKIKFTKKHKYDCNQEEFPVEDDEEKEEENEMNNFFGCYDNTFCYNYCFHGDSIYDVYNQYGEETEKEEDEEDEEEEDEKENIMKQKVIGRRREKRVDKSEEEILNKCSHGNKSPNNYKTSKPKQPKSILKKNINNNNISKNDNNNSSLYLTDLTIINNNNNNNNTLINDAITNNDNINNNKTNKNKLCLELKQLNNKKIEKELLSTVFKKCECIQSELKEKVEVERKREKELEIIKTRKIKAEVEERTEEEINNNGVKKKEIEFAKDLNNNEINHINKYTMKQNVETMDLKSSPTSPMSLSLSFSPSSASSPSSHPINNKNSSLISNLSSSSTQLQPLLSSSPIRSFNVFVHSKDEITFESFSNPSPLPQNIPIISHPPPLPPSFHQKINSVSDLESEDENESFYEIKKRSRIQKNLKGKNSLMTLSNISLSSSYHFSSDDTFQVTWIDFQGINPERRGG